MKKAAKVWLITAFALVVIGFVLLGGVITMFGLNKYETNIYSVSENIDDIYVNTDIADIEFVPSGSGECKVECYEDKASKHFVTVENNRLIINVKPKAWYEFIRFSFSSPKITVYLPKTEYHSLFIKESTGDIEIPKDFNFNSIDVSLSTGDVRLSASALENVKAKTSTGDICIENNSVGTLDLYVSTGRVTVSGVICEGEVTVGVSTGDAYLSDIRCKNVISSGSTGDISLDNVIVSEKLSVNRSTGNVKLEGSDAKEIYVKTTTGSVKGSLLTDKVFTAQTSTGDVDLPKSVSGGKCEIITKTGDVKIKIK